MAKLTRLEWTIKTDKGGRYGASGTDSPVDIEIYRDTTLLARVKLEPGNTPRLNNNELATYYWVFRDPEIVGQIVAGVDVPHYESFPEGIRGHLRIKLVAKGNDGWLFSLIGGVVYTGDFGKAEGTGDPVWQTQTEYFAFNTPMQVLSAEKGEGKPELLVEY